MMGPYDDEVSLRLQAITVAGAEYDARLAAARRRERAAAAVAAVLFIVLMLHAVLGHAQRRPDSHDAIVQTLAVVVAHEAGMDASLDEIAAIHAVLTYRAARMRMRYTSFARVYSRRTFAGTTPTNPWATWITPACREPHEWPTSIQWSSRRDDCVALYLRAHRVVAGEHAARCSPVHWGGVMDRDHAAQQRLVRIECGDTRNDFYRLGVP